MRQPSKQSCLAATIPFAARGRVCRIVIVVYCPGGCTDVEIDAPEQRSAHQPEADDPAAV